MGRRASVLVIFLSVLLIISIALPAFAEVKFSWGPYLRIRNEYYKNMKDLADPDDGRGRDTANRIKIKTQLWGKADFDKDTSIYLRLANENLAYFYFEGTSGAHVDKSASKKGYHYDPNEIFVDNLYLDVKNVLGNPVDLRIGRQDLGGQYGEGFLITDGTAGDGGRSGYFNAIKASWKINKANTLDLIYINNPRDEEYLPLINRMGLTYAGSSLADKYMSQNLVATDEEGFVVYLKNKDVKNLNLEAYYMFKTEAKEGGSGVYFGEKTKLSTVGSYAKYSFAPYTLRTQLAYQFGDYGSEDRTGVGGYLYLDRDLKDIIKTWSPSVTLGGIYLSGQDRKTPENEGWDPLWSKYPWISDSYIFTLLGETGTNAYWTNLGAIRGIVNLKPTSKSGVMLAYTYMRAIETVPKSTALTGFTGTSKERGGLAQAKYSYKFNKNFDGYFLAEYFMPGSFYIGDDPSLLLRTELVMKF
ncbi:MAG: hypothetical protein V1490_04205 [Candidatus Omnitrophota bacterium]